MFTPFVFHTKQADVSLFQSLGLISDIRLAY